MTDDRQPGSEDLATLVERLVPGLAERLRGSVDEIELARDGWRVRVRRNHHAPARPAVASTSGGHAGSNGSSPPHAAGAGHGPQLPHLRSVAAHRDARPTTPGRVVATAPAVGVFMPRGDVSLGAHVRAGDRLGIVDLLGVPQDVVAPADGIFASSLVEAGEGVEYGQELLVIEGRS